MNLRYTLLVVLCACGASAPEESTTPRVDGDAMDRRAASWQGHGLDVFERGEGFLPPSGTETVRIELPAGCTAITASASAGVGDLDATLYSPEGEVLAEDVEPDAHPTVRACGEARPAWYVLRAYAGTGSFRWMAASGDEAQMEWVASDVGGAPPVGGSPLASLERTLRERGFDRVVDRRRVTMVEGEPIRFPIDVSARECSTVVAASRNGTPLHLEIERPAEPSIREARAPRVGVQVCGSENAVGVLRGTGVAEVLVVAGSVSNVGGPSALWLGATVAQNANEANAPNETVWTLRPAEVRTIAAPEACAVFEAELVFGAAELTLRSGGRVLARGRNLRAEVCEDAVLVTDAPARVRSQWTTSPPAHSASPSSP